MNLKINSRNQIWFDRINEPKYVGFRRRSDPLIPRLAARASLPVGRTCGSGSSVLQANSLAGNARLLSRFLFTHTYKQTEAGGFVFQMEVKVQTRPCHFLPPSWPVEISRRSLFAVSSSLINSHIQLLYLHPPLQPVCKFRGLAISEKSKVSSGFIVRKQKQPRWVSSALSSHPLTLSDVSLSVER